LWGIIHIFVTMLYLKTPTIDMTTPQIRRVVCETILWCETNIGKKRKRTKLTFKVLTQKSGEQCFGMYDPTINSIIIHRNMCESVRDVVKVVIHEYTHFLQDLRGYSKVLREVGYRNHPQEIEARGNEKMFSNCWTDIKNNLC
jgi:transposase-like protein